MANALVWFRNDLRLDDQPALQAALDEGLVPVCIYVHAPDEEGGWTPGAASDAWRHRSLAALDADLRARGARLRLFVDGRAMDLANNLAFILAALLLMAPFGFIPFSNTLPGLALLFYAIGMIQRDGTAILLGHLANVGTIVYFGILIGGGGMAAHGLLKHFTG